jgi:GxxExxY protein
MMKHTGLNRKITGKSRKIKNRTGKLLYGNLTEKIIGLCYDIHNQYGSGQKESIYQKALAEKFINDKVTFEKEVDIPIKSEDTGKRLGNHRLDFVVDEKVVVETKAIKFTPVKLEQQLYSYLRNSPYKVGLMINFGSSKLFIRRVVLTK